MENVVLHVANGVSDADYSYVTSCLALLQHTCSTPPVLRIASWHGPDVTTESGRPLTIDCNWPDAPVEDTVVILPTGSHWHHPDARALGHIDQVLGCGGTVIAHDQAASWARTKYDTRQAGLVSCAANDPCEFAVYSAHAIGTFDYQSIMDWANRFGPHTELDLPNVEEQPSPTRPVLRLATG